MAPWVVENCEGFFDVGDYLSLFLMLFFYAHFDQQLYRGLVGLYQALKECPDTPFFLIKYME
jgi:hypothetical protein